MAKTNWVAYMQEIQTFSSQFKVKEIKKPKSWRLLVLSNAESAAEEAVFTVQGVLISKELPPLQEKPRYAIVSSL